MTSSYRRCMLLVQLPIPYIVADLKVDWVQLRYPILGFSNLISGCMSDWCTILQVGITSFFSSNVYKLIIHAQFSREVAPVPQRRSGR